LQQEPFILPEKAIVRDPLGNVYVIEGVLGKGEFGAVYLVRERGKLHNIFALKEVINPDKGARERFAFEGEILKRLHHKSLPRVYRVFENDGLKRVYLLMDYVHGQNLEVLRLKQSGHCFSLQLVLDLMAPIVDAIMYLHAQDPPIVHRDIKPANIIIPTGGGRAVLADFGSAKEYVPGSATTMVGHRSPGFAAIEQYRTGTNTRTDMYGLGATIYALLAGITPIDALSRVLASVTEGTDPLKPANQLKPTIPQPVADALQQAMSNSSTDRFETVEEFWHVLQVSVTQKIPSAPSMHLIESTPAEQAIEDRNTQSLPSVRRASHAHSGVLLRVIVILLFILALAGAIFSYLSGFTILLVSCLILLLLSLGLLLGSVTTRTYRRRSENLYKVKG
jgi:serine/threonine protein kinase